MHFKRISLISRRTDRYNRAFWLEEVIGLLGLSRSVLARLSDKLGQFFSLCLYPTPSLLMLAVSLFLLPQPRVLLRPTQSIAPLLSSRTFLPPLSLFSLTDMYQLRYFYFLALAPRARPFHTVPCQMFKRPLFSPYVHSPRLFRRPARSHISSSNF